MVLLYINLTRINSILQFIKNTVLQPLNISKSCVCAADKLFCQPMCYTQPLVVLIVNNDIANSSIFPAIKILIRI